MAIRVLYLQEFRRIGGAERALLALADAIRQVKVEPLVVWPQKDAAFAWLASRGMQAIPLSVPRWRHGVSLPWLPLSLLHLRSRVAPADIDLVHVSNYRSAPVGGIVSRRLGVPCVRHIRELITSEGIAPHEAPSEAETVGWRERLGISPHDPLLGIVAHVLPHKGYDDLIQALALLQEKLPRIRCLIVGGAPQERSLRRLLELAERLSVKDRLIVAGFQDDVVPFRRC
jgi:glycosyltransferase involved in cell wall biosynthesis